MFENINNDMTKAMKEKDKFSLSVLRLLKSALQLEKINKKSDLCDEEVIKVIKKQVKMRNDSISEFQKFNRLEEVEGLKKEIEILKSYLPQELTEEEIDKEIEKALVKINPTGMKDMGKVMSELQKIASQADMSLVSKKVQEKIKVL